VRIRANPTLLSSLGLGLDDACVAVTQGNVNHAKGSFDGSHQTHTIGANDQLLASEQYRSDVVSFHNGATVYPSDVADVVDDAETCDRPHG